MTIVLGSRLGFRPMVRGNYVILCHDFKRSMGFDPRVVDSEH